ncbi:helix-turn-helix transcriptional regulator [Ammonifex thiophilus]|uniref:Helix-turn-helix domain-containing protein n=1 Tax=Ammonifex thiophilus TaxID=444093 RepID=A0A3D8P1T4_9THEO|nr:helix-turn-helix transcriptional regulator [Ammonifex thiophilus]RDV81795.1 helix-turn-helix domain-containing protein [Ammonifex thiophilus]
MERHDLERPGLPAMPLLPSPGELLDRLAPVLETHARQAAELAVRAVEAALLEVARQNRELFELKRRIDEDAEALKEYGGMGSVLELPEKVPVSVEVEERLLGRLREKARKWCDRYGEKKAGLLFPAVFGRATVRVLKATGARRFSRLPAKVVSQVEELIESLDFGELVRDAGPLAVNLLARRLDLGLTQEGAAKECGVARKTYGDWETGRHVPHARNLPAVARFLGVSLAEAGMLVEEQQRHLGRGVSGADARPEGQGTGKVAEGLPHDYLLGGGQEVRGA